MAYLVDTDVLIDGRILVTRNQKHFRMIPGLNLEVPSY